jgi:transcription elongation factor Elf1
VKRYTDKPYFTYTAYSVAAEGICVVCPKCGKMGMVHKEGREDDGLAFKCTFCGESHECHTSTHCIAEAACENCGRFFREDIPEGRQQFKVLNITCPYCGTIAAVPLQRKEGLKGIASEIANGIEPNSGLPLYYQTTFAGKQVWAINRGHLQYLIDYIEADLRETHDKTVYGRKTQADHLPTFMKRAKNRDGMLKALRRLQEK